MDPTDVLIALSVVDKSALLGAMARHAAGRTGHDEAALLQALHARELLGSTGIGRGIAVPHARIPGLRTPFCGFARLAKPIEFGAIDGAPVDLVFLLLSPDNADRSHLALLAAAARRLRDPAVAEALRRERDRGRIAALLE
jgi:nitrogen PTS system EIIA component